MIDLVGRAAERLDLNARPATSGKIEPWLDTSARLSPDALEPTILASFTSEDLPPALEPVTDQATPQQTPEPEPEHAAGVAGMNGTSEANTIAEPEASFESSFIEAAAELTRAEAAKVAEQTAKIIAANHITLDWVALEESGYLTPQSQRSLKAEEFRIIKRPLLRTAFDPEDRHRSIAHVAMVTSPAPGDGKTFTALNLAVSIASERDLHVLLIDADIRNRGLSRALGLTDRMGLMELLTKPEVSMPSVFLRTDVANLAVIPAGKPTSGATEIFASQTMARLARDIATRYPDRFIIIDAPPVLASSEPGVLASHVGQIVMVVQANQTTKRAIGEALALVNTCTTVNFVLNQISSSAGLDRFGYYGKYGETEAH